jgi:hypothetical protein
VLNRMSTSPKHKMGPEPGICIEFSCAFANGTLQDELFHGRSSATLAGWPNSRSASSEPEASMLLPRLSRLMGCHSVDAGPHLLLCPAPCGGSRHRASKRTALVGTASLRRGRFKVVTHCLLTAQRPIGCGRLLGQKRPIVFYDRAATL